MNSTVRPGDGEGSHDLPPDSPQGTLVLEHAYRIERRLETGPFFATWSAQQTPFERDVRIRFYEGFEGLGLSAEARDRLRSHIAGGGDGGLATDVGELESGDPFLVLLPPCGEPLSSWWGSSSNSASRWSGLLRSLRELLRRVEPGQRRELALHRIYVAPGSAGPSPRLLLYALGDHPTRAEVRQMSGLVTAELVRGFPPECFLPEHADSDGLEDVEAADVWRLGVVLTELLGGGHPLFPDGCDVADVAAQLVGGFMPRSGPAGPVDPLLDERLAGALRLDPEERIGLDDLCGPLRGETTESAPSTATAAEVPAFGTDEARSQLPRLFRLVVGLLAVVLIVVATYLVSNQPPTSTAVVITSEPDGVRFEQVTDDGRVVDLGRTPLLIDSAPIDASLSIRPVYEDGQPGETLTLSPDRLELFEACRRLNVQFEP